MSESERPSIQSVQRSLLIGILVGVVFGCVAGAALVGIYVNQNPPVYAGGAYPAELTESYQDHYLAMTVDSYIVNQQSDVALERLKTFDQQDKIRVLGERSAAYVAAGRGVEAQLINNAAVALKSTEGWDDNAVKIVVGELALEYQSDPAKAQAINTFSAQLLQGQVPDLSTAPGAVSPETGDAQTPGAAPPIQAGALPWQWFLLCCVGLLILAAIVYFVGRRRFETRKAPTKQQIVWEGEGVPPLKQWTGKFELGQDSYDEFFTIETDDGDFLGESGMGIMEAIPGTSPKQVVAFDVGLFDKTDITTLSRVVMTQSAYDDEAVKTKIAANPQAEAVLAELGKEFSFETTALRVDARIEEMDLAQGETGQTYFSKLTVTMNLFLKEGADVRKGEMDVPAEFQS
jgi:hypothetical protein